MHSAVVIIGLLSFMLIVGMAPPILALIFAVCLGIVCVLGDKRAG